MCLAVFRVSTVLRAFRGKFEASPGYNLLNVSLKSAAKRFLRLGLWEN